MVQHLRAISYVAGLLKRSWKPDGEERVPACAIRIRRMAYVYETRRPKYLCYRRGSWTYDVKLTVKPCKQFFFSGPRPRTPGG